MPAVGQATGRSIRLRIGSDPDSVITLVGSGVVPIEQCGGDLSGAFASSRCAKRRHLDRERNHGSLIAMDGKAFDSWTRAHAVATNRRSLLGLSITAGVASVLSRVFPRFGAIQWSRSADPAPTTSPSSHHSPQVQAFPASSLSISARKAPSIAAYSPSRASRPPRSSVRQPAPRSISSRTFLMDRPSRSPAWLPHR